MFAQKGNRVYKVTEETKKDYLKRGFDIYNKDGKLIEANPNKTISYSEHMKEVEILKKEIEELKKAPKEGAKGKKVSQKETEPVTPKEGAKDGKVQE